MPTSNPTIIPVIINIIRELHPTKILDLGIGKGKYGFLIREYLEGNINNKNLIINGVEGYSKNITQLQEKIYDNIFNEDIRNTRNYLLNTYDLIIMIDVFEHLTKDDAIQLITEITKKSKYILIAVPCYVTNQKGFDDDPKEYEKHRYFWKYNELKKYFNCSFISNNTSEYIFIISNEKLPHNIINMSNKQLILKFFPPIGNEIKRFFDYLFNKKDYI